MNDQDNDELRRIYEIAEARIIVADDLGLYLAVTWALLAYEWSGRWWIGVILFPVFFIGVRYEYRKKFESAESAYFEAPNSD